MVQHCRLAIARQRLLRTRLAPPTAQTAGSPRPGAPDTATTRRQRLARGGRRFANLGVGLAGLAVLLPPELTGDLRTGLLVIALAAMALGV
jgi:hypothetical protein